MKNNGMTKHVQATYEDLLLNALENNSLRSDDYYKVLGEKQSELRNKILSMLGEEGKDLMMKLDEIDSERGYVEQKTLYEQGLHDGVSMLKLLKAI